MSKLIRGFLTALAFCVISTQIHAVTLSLQPSSQYILEDDAVSLDLIISGLDVGGPDSLAAFSLDVLFSSNVLTYSSLEFGPYLGEIGLTAFSYVDDSSAAAYPGMVYLDEVSILFDWELDMLQDDSFTLATFNFIGANPGYTLIAMDNVVLSDAFGYELTNPTLEKAGITVAEPSSIGLFLVCLMLFTYRSLKLAKLKTNKLKTLL
jgi:hypothetical protein